MPQPTKSSSSKPSTRSTATFQAPPQNKPKPSSTKRPSRPDSDNDEAEFEMNLTAGLNESTSISESKSSNAKSSTKKPAMRPVSAKFGNLGGRNAKSTTISKDAKPLQSMNESQLDSEMNVDSDQLKSSLAERQTGASDVARLKSYDSQNDKIETKKTKTNPVNHTDDENSFYKQLLQSKK